MVQLRNHDLGLGFMVLHKPDRRNREDQKDCHLRKRERVCVCVRERERVRESEGE
jgi:hypothetical protein